MSDSGTKRVLGIDLGVRSVGWALVEYGGDNACGVIALGSHTFDAGMEGDIEAGREESRNLTRRNKRMIRRQTERRARRMRKLANLLQRHGFLPEGDVSSSAERHELLTRWDRDWLQRHRNNVADRFHHVANTLPYHLRAKALVEPLTPQELGRAIYHLGQRRGFLSNRKSAVDSKDDGVVKEEIKGLREEMEQAASPSLGAHLAAKDPHEKRIRHRYTHRSMFLEEFDRICEAQIPHHPQLAELRDALRKAIFFQRKLESTRKLVGLCTYERRDRGWPQDRRRAPVALLECQRFRILQTINNLRYRDADDNWQPLSTEQRRALVEALDRQGEMTWTKVITMAGLPRKTPLNLQETGEKGIRGNTTAAKLISIFGDRWHDLTPEEQRQVVEDVRSYEKQDKLALRGMNRWGLSEEEAKRFSELSFEAGYMSLSRQAIATLTPYLEEGKRTDEAIAAVYGTPVDLERFDLLPPVLKVYPQELKNPTVIRTLSQMRKVVNAVIKKYGKPDRIHLELARDVKRSKKERQKIARSMRLRQAEREQAKGAITDKCGISEPRARDIEKYLLWLECNGICPYSGKPISMQDFFGEHPRFDIEHIIPYSRSLDDSFANKTLCCVEHNRTRKKKRTPYEAYTPEELQEILQRVVQFKGDLRKAKMNRFCATPETVAETLEGFTTADLNNTRYANRLAASYCKLLYGDETSRVHVCNGSVTAALRNLWGVNSILGDGGQKSRDDHRHHALDALMIALASPAIVHAVARDAQDAERRFATEGKKGRRLPNFVNPPWEDFYNTVRNAVLAVNTSIHVDKRVRGALHKESFYAPPRFDDNGKQYTVIREPLDSFTNMKQLDAIVDPVVRRIVKEAAQAAGGNPSKAFNNPENHPFIPTRKGGRIPIHKVRVRKSENTFQVGQGERARHVVSKSNHHMAIFEVVDARGKVKWQDRVVSQYEALQRKKAGLPILLTELAGASRLVMTLQPGDIITMDMPDGTRPLLKVRGISDNEITCSNINDARLKKDLIATGDLIRIKTNVLNTRQCKKVAVNFIGEVLAR